MKTSPTILFIPWDSSAGRVNACVGVAQQLLSRGHGIVFAANILWTEKLKNYGFKVVAIDSNNNETDVGPLSETKNIETLLKMSPIEKLGSIEKQCFTAFIERAKFLNPLIDDIVHNCKPDLIVVDSPVVFPSIAKNSVPWILLHNANPLKLFNDANLPPPGSGLPSIGNPDEWTEYRCKYDETVAEFRSQYNQWLHETGLPKLEDSQLIYLSPHLNLYGYPEELDYDVNGARDNHNFCRIDGFARTDSEPFELPIKLRHKSGHLIYVSLGSSGSSDVPLMKRIVKVLSKSQHNFIVAKGPLYNGYELAHNMWGRKSVPQTHVLPLVDLVVTSGGTGTVTEALRFGKKMIVMPFIGEQYDNAERLRETGLGFRLDPYLTTETEILETIENALTNGEMAKRLAKVKQRIDSDNGQQKMVTAVEALLGENNFIDAFND